MPAQLLRPGNPAAGAARGQARAGEARRKNGVLQPHAGVRASVNRSTKSQDFSRSGCYGNVHEMSRREPEQNENDAADDGAQRERERIEGIERERLNQLTDPDGHGACLLNELLLYYPSDYTRRVRGERRAQKAERLRAKEQDQRDKREKKQDARCAAR